MIHKSKFFNKKKNRSQNKVNVTKKINIYRHASQNKKNILLCGYLIKIEDFSYARLTAILTDHLCLSNQQIQSILTTVKNHYGHISLMCSMTSINCLPALKKSFNNHNQIVDKIKFLEKELNNIQSMLRPLSTRSMHFYHTIIETLQHHHELCYALSNYRTHVGTLLNQIKQMQSIAELNQPSHF
ncbi:MAG: hypothetical protein HAW62_05660 [Endozoicomonadaceae bacterium]|nr:hypothetical protein [Endozoicomonadaceae bacterium]